MYSSVQFPVQMLCCSFVHKDRQVRGPVVSQLHLLAPSSGTNDRNVVKCNNTGHFDIYEVTELPKIQNPAHVE